MSLLVKSGILGLFVNTLTADAKYYRHNRGNLPNQFKCIYFKNENIFLTILLHF